VTSIALVAVSAIVVLVLGAQAGPLPLSAATFVAAAVPTLIAPLFWPSEAYSAGRLKGWTYTQSSPCLDQPANRVPCLKLASHWRTRSASARPIFCSVRRIDGQVPSPTPMIGMSGDSTRTTSGASADSRFSAAIRLAVIHPAVPPPTTTILRTASCTA
jgi:hypothetical protein